ncbi:MAG: DISARM system phospholipase D-like protein DrmC [Archangium sp.]|nr:DISARM system phospholipase D-like protein DrmC [Archangium sp.]MDP3156524.1 DISARM system phospholipase D-like protein DrmC [Archangium sp.]MDP3573867.1 DISARM system phospholipase D-like protein DrmC [Archangium sp.]
MPGRWSPTTIEALSRALRTGRLSVPTSTFGIARAVGGLPFDLEAAVLRWGAGGMSAAVMADVLETVQLQSEPEEAVSTELVWTGPEAADTGTRDTSVVVRELFGAATQRVLVAGFAFVGGRDLFEPLAKRMDEAAELDVTFFVNVAREGAHDLRDPATVATEWGRNFRERQWPGKRFPKVFYDPRSLSDDKTVRASLHAKTVVIDGSAALVTSANFTSHAQTRNVELGLLVRGSALPALIERQFSGLVTLGHVSRLAGC